MKPASVCRHTRGTEGGPPHRTRDRCHPERRRPLDPIPVPAAIAPTVCHPERGARSSHPARPPTAPTEGPGAPSDACGKERRSFGRTKELRGRCFSEALPRDDNGRARARRPPPEATCDGEDGREHKRTPSDYQPPSLFASARRHTETEARTADRDRSPRRRTLRCSSGEFIRSRYIRSSSPAPRRAADPPGSSPEREKAPASLARSRGFIP